MGKIIKLDEHLTNMIAAGEVVERPMGVIKELVENSIDAQATQIEISIIDGGIQLIEVNDNGNGMDKEDASNAFLRHATSKIKTVKDLWSIRTLGFRGEALPSIASVSKTTMLTSDGEDQTRIEIHYGKTVSMKPYACARGTSVKVEGLFHKTPARLKHQKTVNSETNAVIDLVEKFALSHPEIAFKLINNGSMKFQTTGNGNLQEVLFCIYGKEIATNSTLIAFDDYDFAVEGVIVLPSVSRATKQYMTVFVNNRVIKNYVILKAIEEAYSDYLVDDRYPICVLNITMDYQLVDVNVHPSKWEIRITKERQLFNLIKEHIKQELYDNMRVAEFTPSMPLKPTKPVYQEQQFFPDFHINENTRQDSYLAPQLQEEEKYQEEADSNIEEEFVEGENSIFLQLEVIGQLHGKYILAQGVEGLYIIDQHAAEEKYNYEMFKRELSNQEIMMQDLLVPIVIELPLAKISQLDNINLQMANIGLNFELFGSNTVIIRTIPIWLDRIDKEAFIQDMIDLYDEKKEYSIEEIKKDALASIACHFSIKFNRVLTIHEMRQVITNLSKCEQPFNCPHGRPTIISITTAQLLKEFKRG